MTTPFQEAGYNENTIFVKPNGARIQLREDDGSPCPYFNFEGTNDFSGCEWIRDLKVDQTGMTPFQKAGYTKDTIFTLNDGTRVKLEDDDGTEAPYFDNVDTGNYHGCERLSDLTVETLNAEKEIQFVANQTPFEAAGYTAETLFRVPQRKYLIKLRRDDNDNCPSMGYAEGPDVGAFAGYFNLFELAGNVFEPKSQAVEASEGEVEDNSLEGLIVLVRGARSELARVEALLAAKTEELGITVVISETEAPVLGELTLTNATDMWEHLSVGDTVRVKVKPQSENTSEFDLSQTYKVAEVDLRDRYRPIRVDQWTDEGVSWVRPEYYNLVKLS